MIKLMFLFSALLLFWLGFNLIVLIYRNNKATGAFKKVDLLFQKRYSILDRYNLDNNIRKYLEELKTLPAEYKFLNRKLALNFIIIKGINDTNITEEEFKIINSELAVTGNLYNKYAEKLKHSVEIFPTSLMARFLRIKTVDFFRE